MKNYRAEAEGQTETVCPFSGKECHEDCQLNTRWGDIEDACVFQEISTVLDKTSKTMHDIKKILADMVGAIQETSSAIRWQEIKHE